MVRARIANIHSVALVANDRVFNEKTVVFVDVPFSVMQSTIHEIWAREHSSTLRKDMQYTPSDCFDTFPFPNLAALSDSQASEYREHRQSVMFNRKEGLTSTYNRFHNAAEKSSDIVKLRELHISMDRIVANAYGWTDLKLLYDFHPTKQGIRFTFDDHIRSEVLDRLLALNQAYFRDEVAAGLHVKTGSDNGGKSRKGASSKVDSRQAQLF